MNSIFAKYLYRKKCQIDIMRNVIFRDCIIDCMNLSTVLLIGHEKNAHDVVKYRTSKI